MAKKETIVKKKTVVKKATPKKTVEKEVVAKETSVKTSKTESKTSFAVIEVSGNQYLVQVGKEYSVKKVVGYKGEKYVCENVLLLVDGDTVKIGKPYLKDVKVECEIASQKKDEKVNTFRYTAKSRLRKRVGSRALITKLLIKKFVA